MIVDVSWDGVKLATGAQAREEAGGWFVELEQPMPVGTRLVLDGEAQATVRVARVHEGLGAGMLVRAEGAVAAHAPKSAAKAAASAAEAVAAPSVIIAEPASASETGAATVTAPSVIVAEPASASETGAAATGDDSEPEAAANGNGNAGGKRDRRKRKKPNA